MFDWRLAEGAPSGVRLLLAGGLTPDNVGEAIQLVRPWGVDVSSGVEAAAGPQGPAQAAAVHRGRARRDGRGDERSIDRASDRRPRDAGRRARPFDWQLDELTLDGTRATDARVDCATLDA